MPENAMSADRHASPCPAYNEFVHDNTFTIWSDTDVNCIDSQVLVAREQTTASSAERLDSLIGKVGEISGMPVGLASDVRIPVAVHKDGKKDQP